MLSFAPWRPREAAGTGQYKLVQRLVQGDLQALEEIYRKEAGGVYRYALALCGNAAWAADVTQDVFIALAAQPQHFDAARATLGAYLAGAARHALLALWRRQRKELPLDDAQSDGASDSASDSHEGAMAESTAGGCGDSPETLLQRAQTEQALWRALRGLPWPFREALVLVDLQGRSYLEAAQIAGIELNTLRTRVHRGRKQLAMALDALDTLAAPPPQARRANQETWHEASSQRD